MKKKKGPPFTKTINNEEFKEVKLFTYLGSILTENHNINEEICNRINKASAEYGILRTRVFQNENLRLSNKVSGYIAVCISTLLYGADLDSIQKISEAA